MTIAAQDAWARVSNARQRLNENIELYSGKWGGLTARHPLKVLLCSLVVFAGLFLGNLTMCARARARAKRAGGDPRPST